MIGSDHTYPEGSKPLRLVLISLKKRNPLVVFHRVRSWVLASNKLRFYLFADDTNLLYADRKLKSLETIVNAELLNVCDWLSANKLSLMHQSIPPVPIPPPRAIVGHFPALSIPGVGALAFHPITPGHLTISLLSPHNIIVSFNDHFIGKYGKFLLEYV